MYTINGIDVTNDIISTNTTIKASRNIVGNDPILIQEFQLQVSGAAFKLGNAYGLFPNKEHLYAYEILIDDNVFDNVIATISEVNWDDNKDIATIKAYPIINKFINTLVEYYNDDISPSQALEEILILNNLEDTIDTTSFIIAKGIQEANNLLCSMTVQFIDNTTIADIINQLGVLSGADIYVGLDNKLYYLQYNSNSDVDSSFIIDNDSIITMTLNDTSKDVKNAYTVDTMWGKWNSEDTTFGDDSISKYDKKQISYNFSSNKIISCNSILAIIWGAENATRRVLYPARAINIKCLDNLAQPMNLSTIFKIEDIVYGCISVERDIKTGLLTIKGVEYV